MKKIVNLIKLIVLVGFASCSNPSETEVNPEMQKLTEENQRLKDESTKKDEEIGSFIQSFNEIQANLDLIKEREKVVSKNTSDPELQNTKQQQIADDINTINELITKNKEKIAVLNKKLKKANLRIDELEKMVASLTKQVEAKDAEIIALKEDLEKANNAYKDLFKEYNAKLDEIDTQTNKMNVAFYAFGTAKELKEKGVITKEGGFIGIGKAEKLRDDFNKDYFTKIDVSETNNILLGVKKAKIITTHASSSYKLEGSKDKVEKLSILNAEEFWSASKYLVIVTE
ncbi:MAG: hypothetical protein J0M08_11735 [Bacteroidetes bacterium]|nr:hypothetical protein [Bacteroidota bacterium]